MHRADSTIIKQSPVVIVKNYLGLQVAAVAAFFFARVFADYGQLYKNSFAANYLPYHLAEAVGLFVLETVIVFYIFFRWYKDYYDFRSDKIIHGRGIIFRRKEIISLRSIDSLSYRQGPLGKMTRYGRVEFYDGTTGKRIRFQNIPEPQQFVELVARAKEKLAFNNHQDTIPIHDLVNQDEHEGLEFKSTFRWDTKQNKVNKQLEKAVMKTIAAFLNSQGGHLVIGIDDSRNIIGLAADYKSLPKPTVDGFKNHFSNVFHTMIGPSYRQFVRLTSHQLEGKELCLVQVEPSDKPAYLQSDEREEFYIRTGNGTTSLKLSEASSYIDSRWRGQVLLG